MEYKYISVFKCMGGSLAYVISAFIALSLSLFHSGFVGRGKYGSAARV